MEIPGFEPGVTTPTASQIDGLELLLGVKLPESYRALLARYNGAYGGAKFPVPGTEYPGSIGLWCSVLPWDPESVWGILNIWEANHLPRALVPFGIDGGGDVLCFDYRESEAPSVVVWYHELSGADGVHQIAPSFTDFLKVLRADD